MTNFQLRNVLDIYKDLDPEVFRHLKDITALCIQNGLQPTKTDDEMLLEERLDSQIKNTLFEHSYLNEKILKANYKCKSVLYPQLQKK